MFLLGRRILVSPIAYNTDLVKKEDAPKSFADLLDPKWAGKMVKAHPASSGTIMNSTFQCARDLGWDYFEKLAKQRVLQVQLRRSGDVSAVIELPGTFVVYVCQERTSETLSVAALAKCRGREAGIQPGLRLGSRLSEEHVVGFAAARDYVLGSFVDLDRGTDHAAVLLKRDVLDGKCLVAGDHVLHRLSVDPQHFVERVIHAPEHPLGATMVSTEGACAAYFHYRRPRPVAATESPLAGAGPLTGAS